MTTRLLILFGVSIVIGLFINLLTLIFLSLFGNVNAIGSSLIALKIGYAVKIFLNSLVPLLIWFVLFWLFVKYSLKQSNVSTLRLIILSLFSILIIFLTISLIFDKLDRNVEKKFKELESGQYNDYLKTLKNVSDVKNVNFVYSCGGFDSGCRGFVEFKYPYGRKQFVELYKNELDKNHKVEAVVDDEKADDSNIYICENNKSIQLAIGGLTEKLSFQVIDFNNPCLPPVPILPPPFLR